ncbi:hypothetical protein [endosymbiont GvMRE of Glomus versiforme]|uniref:hypothetical protein n=1 Tax=endosymbiont GvMRE of Glomus versiforme TaxID=2039283 RepID=UPI000EEDD94A|nr:hypothetical protein [endosymbiont GvMRE of Glomus versiforme]RHZ36022.1 hypothetical protein GvMRE_Ic3g73 [endosymbiont GvMRE of Glomus versiforme]
MTVIITKILQQLKSNQETIQRLKRKSRKQQKLLFDLEDNLVHQQEFLKALQIYTQKLVQKHRIDWGEVEKELKETCYPCACVFRLVERFVHKSKIKFQVENNSNTVDKKQDN